MSKKAKTSDNEDFIKYTSFLKSVKNLPLKEISLKIGIENAKMTNIRTGQSSADRFMLSKLKDVFSEELKDYVEPAEVLTVVQATEYAKKEQIEKLEKEVQDLKDIVFKMLAEKVRQEQEDNKKYE